MKLYYQKELCCEEQVVSELLGSYIAKYFNLPTISYQLVGDYTLISEDITEGQTLFQNYKFWNKYYDNLWPFLLKVKTYFKNPDLYQQFFSLAMHNIIMNEEDCNMKNLLFTGQDESDLKLIGVLDFEKCQITSNDANYYFDLGNHFFKVDLKELKKIINFFPELKPIFTKFRQIEIENFLKNIETVYNFKISSDIKYNCLEYEKNLKKKIKSLSK